VCLSLLMKFRIMPGSVAVATLLEHVLRKGGFTVPAPRHLARAGWKWVKCQRAGQRCPMCDCDSNELEQCLRGAEEVWAALT